MNSPAVYLEFIDRSSDAPSTPSSTTSHHRQRPTAAWMESHSMRAAAAAMPAAHFEMDSRGSIGASSVASSAESVFQVQAFPSVGDVVSPSSMGTGIGGVFPATEGPTSHVSKPMGATTAFFPALPPNTVHTALHGNVAFIPYPQTVGEVQRFLAMRAAERDQAVRAGLSLPLGPRNVRMFLGQLPYNVTEMQLYWICAVFGGDIAQPQRITKTTDKGEKIPTGGVHVMCDETSFQLLLSGMHKRVLIDDTGLWFAENHAQKANLDSYVAYLHTHKKARKAGRPYESVVVQEANSTFVPRRSLQFDATVRR